MEKTLMFVKATNQPKKKKKKGLKLSSELL